MKRLCIVILAIGLAAASWAARNSAGLTPMEAAAKGAGEPSLQAIMRHMGYTMDAEADEVPAPLFEKAGPGPVVSRPIAAFGLPKVCQSGWYRPVHGSRPPKKRKLWSVDGPFNKQYGPPIILGSVTSFNPGRHPFGLWVATGGFPKETIYTDGRLQRFTPRFKPTDQHKVRAYPARAKDCPVPNTYVLGWEYSTNNDFQDIVTVVENVHAVSGGKAAGTR